jgi:TPR repeat protein
MNRKAFLVILLLLSNLIQAQETSRFEADSVGLSASTDFRMALAYENGSKGKKNTTKAIELYKIAIQKGYFKAYNNLALLYLKSPSIKNNCRLAIDLLKKAVAGNDIKAFYNLGVLYESGIGLLANENKAIELYKKASEMNHSGAMNNLAGTYLKQKKYAQALALYNQGAKLKNTLCYCNLGILYENGYGIPKNSSKAFYWYQLAAKAGNAVAQNNLAGIYSRREDDKQAVFWYEKAAQQKNNTAIANLANCYEFGYYVRINLLKAQALRNEAKKNKTPTVLFKCN